VDGFGSFNFTIDGFDGFTHAVDTLNFTIQRSNGKWANAADVLAANSGGFLVAGHVFVTSSPADASNGAVVTGYASGSTVPEPSLLLLLGLGLGAVGSIAWRLKL